jgi:hypothetical protein
VPAGGDDALWVGFDCDQAVLHLPGQTYGQGQACSDFGTNGLTVEMGATSLVVDTDGCSQLSAWHDLGTGPFYLFLGAGCSLTDCPGYSLDLPGTHVLVRQM